MYTRRNYGVVEFMEHKGSWQPLIESLALFTDDFMAESARLSIDEEAQSSGAGVSMPEISRFFGIIIRMYTETGEPHHTPHLHAYYQDSHATYQIDAVELLAGSLPSRQHRLVEAWMELYQEELLENWHLVEAGELIKRVPPLRR